MNNNYNSNNDDDKIKMNNDNTRRRRYGILIVDMQLCLVPGRDRDKDNIDSIVPSTLYLLHAGVNQQVPIIFLEYRGGNWRDTLPELLHQLPDPQQAVIIPKKRWCGFEGTKEYGSRLIRQGNHTLISLGSYLESLNLTDLIIGGWHVELCIKETINHAIRLGYAIHTAADIVAPIYLSRPLDNLRKIVESGTDQKVHTELYTYDTIENLLEATIA